MTDHTLLIRCLDTEGNPTSEWYEVERLVMVNTVNKEPHLQVRNIENQRLQWPLTAPEHLRYEWKVRQ